MMEIFMWVIFALVMLVWVGSLATITKSKKHSLLFFVLSTAALVLWVVYFG